MRTIGLTVMLIDEHGNEEKGELVMMYPDTPIDARKVLAELLSECLDVGLLKPNTAFLVKGTMGLYLEVTDLDDRDGVFLLLDQNAMRKVPVRNRINWTRTFLPKKGGDDNG